MTEKTQAAAAAYAKAKATVRLVARLDSAVADAKTVVAEMGHAAEQAARSAERALLRAIETEGYGLDSLEGVALPAERVAEASGLPAEWAESIAALTKALSESAIGRAYTFDGVSVGEFRRALGMEEPAYRRLHGDSGPAECFVALDPSERAMPSPLADKARAVVEVHGERPSAIRER